MRIQPSSPSLTWLTLSCLLPSLYQQFPRNFTVTWDNHTYTYRTDSNATYWDGASEVQSYGFAVYFYLGVYIYNCISWE